jgi:hypothetical protein
MEIGVVVLPDRTGQTKDDPNRNKAKGNTFISRPITIPQEKTALVAGSGLAFC